MLNSIIIKMDNIRNFETKDGERCEIYCKKCKVGVKSWKADANFTIAGLALSQLH